jgi:glycosyltransferase involved in cell wall biosynthesis
MIIIIQTSRSLGLRSVMVEAMACGTPVVAFHRGSASEIIDQGVTGAV